MSALATLWRQCVHLTRPVADYALPPRCPACGTVVQDDDQFCLPCWLKIDFLGEPCCAQCGIPFAHAQDRASLCGGCLANPPPVDSARAVLAYGDVARAVALKFKYGRRIGLARLIGGQMVRHVPETGRENMVLIPVPLHRWRLWSRGFNQSALIARVLGRQTGVAVDPLTLVRTRHTPPLRGMNPKKRARAVRGCFGIAPGGAHAVRGRVVVLVDDVHTSGATAYACARVLRAAGAAQVHLLSWARVLPDREGR